MSREDPDHMRRWLAGDPAAFADLVARWQQPVARFVARLAGADRAADLCQEVFLRVLQAGPRYRETGHFSTWLFRSQSTWRATPDAGRAPLRCPYRPTTRPASTPRPTLYASGGNWPVPWRSLWPSC